MKTISKTLFCALAVSLFASCAATRPLGDAAFGAGGAYIANQLSEGMAFVLVNGVAVIDGGKATNALPGKVLRGAGFKP